MNKTLKKVTLLDLQPHPENQNLYGIVPPGGFDQNLIRSLQKEVWPGDIQITTGNVIISGHRRIEHCTEGNVETAVVWVRDDLPKDPMSPEVLEALLEANLQRNKDEWTKSQELKLWNEVEVLYSRTRAAKAKHENKSAPKPKGSGASKRAEVPAIKKAAARMGLEEGEKKLRQRVQVVQAVEAAAEAGLVEEAMQVKQALNSSPTAAVRMAKAVGLIETKTKKKEEPAQVELIKEEPLVFGSHVPAASETPVATEPKKELPNEMRGEVKVLYDRVEKVAKQMAAACDELRKLDDYYIKSHKKNGRSVVASYTEISDHVHNLNNSEVVKHHEHTARAMMEKLQRATKTVAHMATLAYNDDAYLKSLY